VTWLDRLGPDLPNRSLTLAGVVQDPQNTYGPDSLGSTQSVKFAKRFLRRPPYNTGKRRNGVPWVFDYPHRSRHSRD